MSSASTDLPRSIQSAEPVRATAGAIQLGAAHSRSEAQADSGGASHLPRGRSQLDPHARSATGIDLPAAQDPLATHTEAGGGTQPAPAHDAYVTRTDCGGGSAKQGALLLVLADALDDLEQVRIATQNRVRSLGQVKGLADTREARTMQNVADALAALEHAATLDLKRAMRAHPLGPWIKRTNGLGEKQAARLLAAIGDPAERKMPSQLWQYCGHGAPSKRQRGVKTFWSPTAKMRVHLMAESCMKCRTSPYRAVYDDARTDWASREVSDGHKHNHALRMVGKAILLDLWTEARRVA